MQEIYNMTLQMAQSYINKMIQSHAIYGGIIGAVLAIPAWVERDFPTREHGIMMGILLAVLVIDWLTGSQLAKRSPVSEKLSHTANISLIRDFIIVLMCGMAVGLDCVLNTKSFIFAIFTAAFIWQNFYSVLGNLITLGWGKYFPMWMFSLIEKWVQDEVRSKQNKYFPTVKGEFHETKK
ncbi:phage holin family protein [Pediococcus pentosaceus]|uniref:phage holin family protein n=1 Tax=Pediococcus pentosaceus TaxID=1255 RepID=UPI0021A65750|nr:phage holin family protein [Pediococcus pentosaceus]